MFLWGEMGDTSRYDLAFVRGTNLKLSPHPESCQLAEIGDFASRQDGPLAIDLFCGAGGLSLGLQEAGFSVILGVDKDENALSTHESQFGGASVLMDLSSESNVDSIVQSLQHQKVSLVAGSPPCQPFSSAGRYKIRSLVNDGTRPELDPRKELWQSFVDVVAGVSPDAVLIENVPGIALGSDALVFRQIVAELEGLGYDVYSQVLSAWKYGVPQHRQRLIIVGMRRGISFTWPEQREETQNVLADAIADLPQPGEDSADAPLEYIRPASGSPILNWFRQGVERVNSDQIYDHFARRVRADDLEAFKLMDSNTRYSELPESLRRYRADIFKDKYKRLAMNELSRTITAHIAKDGYWYIHPEQHRTLTIREAARIQTFPDAFRFSGFPSHAFRQIGEAVPPLLGLALGQAIRNSLEGRVEGPSPLSTSLLSRTLSGWLDQKADQELGAPWLNSSSPWHVFLGMILFEALSIRTRRAIWPTIKHRWPTPQAYLNDGLRKPAARAIGQAAKSAVLDEFAEKLVESGNQLLDSDYTIPGLSDHQMVKARALCGLDPKITLNTALLRLVERVFNGNGDPGRSRLSGQILLSRLIGVNMDGRTFAAAVEISEQLCLQGVPHCRACPLCEICQFSSKTPRAIGQPGLV